MLDALLVSVLIDPKYSVKANILVRVVCSTSVVTEVPVVSHVE